MSIQFPRGLSPEDWDMLVGMIEDNRCVPFLGAGVFYDTQPWGNEIAENWAQEHLFPFQNKKDLSRVAQFLAYKFSGDYVKDKIAHYIQNLCPPNFKESNELHRLLAELPLPLYLTTNYNSFMMQALSTVVCEPLQEFCRWHDQLQFDYLPRVLPEQFDLSIANPVVYHLHGHVGEPSSLVLTEDDYFDFLVAYFSKGDLLPSLLRRSLMRSSLLLLGYRIDDWDFRVLLRCVSEFMTRNMVKTHIALQISPLEAMAPSEQLQQALDYLEKYFDRRSIRVYWGTSREFAQDLREHWGARKGRLDR